MTLRWTLPLSVLLLALVIGSCAWLGQVASGGFQKPSLAYKSVSLSDVSLSGATVDVVTTVTNPNAVDLSVAEVDYRLSVDGHPVASGTPPAGLQIPARGSADLTLPATVRFAELGQALSAFLTQDSAKYKAEGTVGLNTPVGIVRVPVSHEGTFPVPKMPAISLGVPRITHAALDQATVELPLVLTNRSPYSLPIQGITAGVSLAGAQVGDVSATGLGTLDPHGTRTVSLPLTIRLASAVEAGSAILRGGTVPIAVDGALQSGPAAAPFSLRTTAQFRR
jgi:LEA14-like dessication related protein